MRTAVLLCALLWCLVDSQTEPPYISFRGETLLNHGYVDLSLVGDASSGSDSVQCRTDLTSCCTGGLSDSTDRPDWYFPNNGSGVRFMNDGGDIYQDREARRIDLRRRNNVLSPSGIYRCEIPTGDTNNFVRETVYVGIYSSGGAVTVSGVELSMISADEFTLTCTSTGGPATTVTWTRNMEPAVGERRSEVVNEETAQYANTLTVTGRMGGDYTCTVTNDVTPDGASASITVQVTSAPTNVMAEQEGPDGIGVTWTPSSGANGYIISYDNGAGSSDSVTVDGGSTESFTLMDLQNGATYTISIVATSETSLPSESMAADMMVSLVPARPSLRLNTNSPTTATSISLSWSVADSEVTSSVVSWEREISGECPDEDRDSTTITGSSTSTTINGRQEDSRYFITVTVFNAAGSSEVSNTVTAVTMEAAPSAAPTDVSATTSTSTTITVQWGPVDCIDRNGDITGYSVQYWAQDQSTQTRSAPGDSSGGSYEITGLQSSTTYSIQVAAITGASRIGPYSSTITEDTSVRLSVTSIVSSSSTTLVISWTLDDGVMVESYTISYSNTDTDCFTDSDIITGIDGSTMSHELSGLKEGTEYSVTVTAQLASGETVADMQTAITSATTPSAAPISVSVSVVNSTAITVQWEMVPCIHHNGDITGYSVRYTGDGSAQNTFVIGGGATMTTISDLRSSAAYVIEVAVVNSDGTGVYSAPQSKNILTAPSPAAAYSLIPPGYFVHTVVVPGQPSVSVTSITATSISLSWSVPSDSVVTSYEVMWRETDSGATEMTSGSLTDTSYTIEQLDSTTIYTVTVTATNSAGISTDSLPIIISTGSTITDSRTEEVSDDTAVITGGVVVAVVILSLSVAAIVIVLVIVSRNRKGRYTTGHKRGPMDTTNRALGLSKLSDEAAYVDPDVIRTSSNEAYHTVSQTGGTTTGYETSSDPHTVPPSTSHSSQPPTTGDYEQV